MSFDLLTIVGIIGSVLCGGFVFALVARNDRDTHPNGGFIHGADEPGAVHPRS